MRTVLDKLSTVQASKRKRKPGDILRYLTNVCTPPKCKPGEILPIGTACLCAHVPAGKVHSVLR